MIQAQSRRRGRTSCTHASLDSEGADAGAIDDLIAEMRSQLEAARAGEPLADAPEEVRTLMDTVARFVQLVDRETGTLVGIAFCESEDDMRRADEALNRMSPSAGGGSRTSADVYEVAIDQSFR